MFTICIKTMEEFIQHFDVDLAIEFRSAIRLNYYSFTYIILVEYKGKRTARGCFQANRLAEEPVRPPEGVFKRKDLPKNLQ